MTPFSRSLFRQFVFGVSAATVFSTAGAQAQTAPTLIPYTAKLVAGSGTAAIASGATCPVSGFKATDAYGDGCLATEIQLTTTTTSGSGPRYAIADSTGAVFFSDGTNGLIRRVDPVTGIVTRVAGGASSTPGTGTACGTGVSADPLGDGCPANAVKLSHPQGLAFDASGNLYFADSGSDTVRKIAATGGLIATTGTISLVVGNPSTTFGYNVSNAPGQVTPIVAAGNGYINFPYGIAFDKAGNLYIADEGNQALEVVNLGTLPAVIQGIATVPGAIYKIAGFGSGTSTANPKATNVDCPNYAVVGTTTYRGGCYFGTWTDGNTGVSSATDNPYALAVGPTGTVYFANEFNDNIGQLSAGNVISNFAGLQGSVSKTLLRGKAGTFAIGSPFGVATDPAGDVYVTDASSGVIWRVDAGSKAMYVVAGGASVVCTSATDSNGDGCPGLQATYGSSGTTFASTTLPGPGIFGITVDGYSNLYVGDTETALIRQVVSGTQFGAVGLNPVTNTVEVHFAAGDSAAKSGAFTITTGSANFTLGTATCNAANTDGTVDCLLPLTAKGTTLGAFSGTLHVASQAGATADFPLSGTYVNSPTTRTSVTAVPAGTTCGSSTTYSTATTITLTATVASTGTPTGTVQFYNNGVALGAPVNVSSGATATLAQTFATGSNSITAVYSGDSFFTTSTAATAAKFTTATPNFYVSPVVPTPATGSECNGTTCTVAAGGTGLYSFTVTNNLYAGAMSFSCAGLPQGASCVFSPQTIAATVCASSYTVALSIVTSTPGPTLTAGFGGGRGGWQIAAALSGFALALLVGVRRRHMGAQLGMLTLMLAALLASTGLMGCGKGSNPGVATPPGTYNVTVTAVGAPSVAPPAGQSNSFGVTLTVK